MVKQVKLLYIIHMKRKIFFILTLSTILLFSLFAGGTTESTNNIIKSLPNLVQLQNSSSNNQDEISRDIDTLERLYRFLDQTYLYDIDREKAYEAMATALFNSLDEKYTYYVSSDEKEDYVENTSGVYAGVGIYFSKILPEYMDPENPDTYNCIVTQVFPETPSSRAGIKAGDHITAVDGQSVKELTPTECAHLMKGDPNTDVVLTILRNTISFDVTLTREIITVPTVEETVLDNNIGYLRILEFSPQTAKATFDSLMKLINQNIESLIIDLRNNGGGDIDVALSIADMFISGDKLLTIKYKNNENNIQYNANNETLLDKNIPIVVLVNGGTASSSEILTGALKDNKRATVVGETTFGKGIMQVVSPFDKGYVSITTANFLPPNDEIIHEIGIVPDIEVTVPTIDEENLSSYEDLLKSNAIKQWVDENPENTSYNIDAFVESQKDCGLPSDILKILVRSEYLSRLPDTERIIADPDYDSVLQRGISFLNTGK